MKAKYSVLFFEIFNHLKLIKCTQFNDLKNQCAFLKLKINLHNILF